MARPLALVTGASAGIGAAFARLLATRGFDPVLVARRADRLQSLAAELAQAHGADSLVLPADLSHVEAPARIAARLEADGRPLAVLVNNAGYGLPGGFGDTAWADQAAVLRVMLTAPLELIHRLAPAMRAQGRGRIVNVASVAGLVPGRQGLYATVKSGLIRASQSLHQEMAADGVHVCALCPGLTWSEFHDVNHMREQLNRTTPAWLWMQAEPVVLAGWRAVEAGRPLCVPGLQNKAMAALARLLPDDAIMRLTASRAWRFPRP